MSQNPRLVRPTRPRSVKPYRRASGREFVFGWISLALVALAPGVARANGTAISSTSGDVTEISKNVVIAAGSLEQGSLVRPAKIVVFREQVDFSLPSDLAVDIQSPGTYGTSLTPGVLAAGSFVTSYLVHFDPGGTGHRTGSIRFDQDILGVIVGSTNLDASDGSLKVSGVTYPTGQGQRSLDLAGGPPVDHVTVSTRQIDLDLSVTSGFDELRVLLQGDGDGVTFSIDFQSLSLGNPAAFNGNMFSEDLLTVGQGGSPGPNPPVTNPWIPGVMAHGSNFGVLSTTGDTLELDAISFGRDAGSRLRFSVDEWTAGVLDTLPPNVFSEGAAHLKGAASDVFTSRSPFEATDDSHTFGSVLTHHGEGGGALPAFGLAQPDDYDQGLRDTGDNLDALDFGTLPSEIGSWFLFSLDGGFEDPYEGPGSRVNRGSAQKLGFSGADILTGRISTPPSAPSAPVVFLSAADLGLDSLNDDIDALAVLLSETTLATVNENSPPSFDWDHDRVYFSVRRGSQVIGKPDSRYNLPISDCDILQPNPGHLPQVFIAGEALGLVTGRATYPTSVTGYVDDLDAMDVYFPQNTPAGLPDSGAVTPAGTVHLDVMSNDLPAYSPVDRSSLRLLHAPLHGTIVSVDSTGFVYRHDGSATAHDAFEYFFLDHAGQSSEAVRVDLRIEAASAVDGGGPSAPLAFSLTSANPFSSQAWFAFRSPVAGRARVEVFDTQGRRVRTVFDRDVRAGVQDCASWAGDDMRGGRAASGVFFARLSTPAGVREIRIVHLH
jgi:hypothetical protein